MSAASVASPNSSASRFEQVRLVGARHRLRGGGRLGGAEQRLVELGPRLITGPRRRGAGWASGARRHPEPGEEIGLVLAVGRARIHQRPRQHVLLPRVQLLLHLQRHAEEEAVGRDLRAVREQRGAPDVDLVAHVDAGRRAACVVVVVAGRSDRVGFDVLDPLGERALLALFDEPVVQRGMRSRVNPLL